MKKKKIIIATHGNLAEGFLSALKIIIGNIENVDVICGYMNADFNLDYEIQKLMADFHPSKQELLVFTDLYGGSMNNGFLRYLTQYPFHLITNTNLGMLIDIVLTMNEVNAEAIREKLQSQDFSAVYCNDLLMQQFAHMDSL